MSENASVADIARKTVRQRRLAAWASPLLRPVVLGRLARLREGRLVIHENGRRHELGPGGGLEVEVTVTGEGFWSSLGLGGSVGAAESWIRGEWHTDTLTDLFRLFLRNREVLSALHGPLAWAKGAADRVRHLLRDNTRRGSKRNILAHYDLSNEFYGLWLDEGMTYSCALFERPEMSLEQAQTAKLDRLCRKMELSADEHLLEIGCGWGSLAEHAAKQYGCRVTAATISDAQYSYAAERIRDAGLEDRVEIVKRDYRELEGQYDAVASVEMIEAVGAPHVPEFFRACERLLKPGGRMGLQAITMDDREFDDYLREADFTQVYIFPGGALVSLTQLFETMKKHTTLRTLHLREIGEHYAETLARWRRRFFKAEEKVRALGLGDGFIRLWQFYLEYSEAGFRERRVGDVQMVMQRAGRQFAV